MSEIQIIVGDALAKMPNFPPGSVDLIVADPPYNLGKNYGNNQDSKEFDEYLAFSRSWLKQSCRILKSTGTLYVFMGFRFISYVYDILERELGMKFNSWIAWHYTQGIGKTRGFSPRHDDILMFTKTESFKFRLDDVRVPQKYYRERNNMRGANPGDVWEFSHVHYSNENRQEHPTQKPEGLVERMILASTDPDDLVVDPFAGSGTTLRVCQQLNRKATGIELNPEYVEMIKKRLAMPFDGFDSVDPRMERVPLDLRQTAVRQEYLENHKKWFLRNHENALPDFDRTVSSMYSPKTQSLESSRQITLFEENEGYQND